ncbi:MAG: hypothetical protein OCD76_08265 [Reichenbachiella sp.]
MHLIWYNNNSKTYEYGNSRIISSLKSTFLKSDALELLVELPEEKELLAMKIIDNLNGATQEHSINLPQR